MRWAAGLSVTLPAVIWNSGCSLGGQVLIVALVAATCFGERRMLGERDVERRVVEKAVRQYALLSLLVERKALPGNGRVQLVQ